MVQLGCGNQFVEVAQAQLVFGQDDEMLGLTAGLSAAAQPGHGRIDRLQAVYPHILQHPEKWDEHIGHCGGVITGPVMLECRQIQAFGHNIQLILAQLGQQVLSQNECIDGSLVKGCLLYTSRCV